MSASALRPPLLFVVIMVAALAPRLASLTWNTMIHGDVGMDASAAASFARDGTLLLFDDRIASAVPDPAPLPPPPEGAALAQHGPVWPILGGLFLAADDAVPTIASAYGMLRGLSLVSGVLLLFLAWHLTRRMLSERDAFWIIAILGASYLLIDYSGNGSFYMLQACLYLLWIFAARELRGILSAAALGVIGGVAYLLNFQSIILLPAGILWFLLQPGPWRMRIGCAAAASAVFVLCVAPWLIRNARVFGDPLWSHAVNSNYLYSKAGMAHLVGERGAVTGESWADRATLLRAMAAWLPNNLYYVARKLFVLLPVVFLAFPFALIDLPFKRAYARAVLPVLIVLVLHLLLSAAWPVPKFRYFVPMTPLVLLLVAAYVRALPWTERRRTLFFGASLLCTAALAVLAFFSTPTHTSYYDGAITTDPFSAQGELQFLRDKRVIR